MATICCSYEMKELNPQIMESVFQLQLKTNSGGTEALYKSEPISYTRIKISKLTTKENC